jgi:hypothetical protein
MSIYLLYLHLIRSLLIWQEFLFRR